jgi:hypothetical protein
MAKLKTLPDGREVLIGRPNSPSKQTTTRSQLRQDLGNVQYDEVLRVAKALYKQVDSESVAGRKPVLNHDDLKLMQEGVLIRPPWRIPFHELRQASYSTSLIGAIHKIRVDDLSAFFRVFVQGKTPEGFGFEVSDIFGDLEKAKNKSHDREFDELVSQAKKFFYYMGDKIEGWSKRDRFHTVGEMMIRDTLAIDRVAFWLKRNAFGKVIEIIYLDPATIYPTGDEGYRNDKSIGWVQIVDNQVVMEFGHEEIVCRSQNHSSDVRYRNFGLSPAESSIMELVTIIYILKKNRDRQSNRTPPEGIITVNGIVSEEALDALSAQWKNIFTGGMNNYAIPIMASENGDIKYQPLNIANDMVFDKLLEWTTGLVCASHGIDPMEVGLRLRDSGALSEASPDGRLKNTTSRAKKSLLSFFSDVCNEIKEHVEAFEPITFHFSGIDKQDENDVLERDLKEVKAFRTVDELRRQRNLPTLEQELIDSYGLDPEKVKGIGGMILDATFNQFASPKLTTEDPNAGMGGDDGQGEEGDSSDEEGEDEDEDFDPDNEQMDDEDEDDDSDLRF